MRYIVLLLRGCLLLSSTWLPFPSLAQITVDSTRTSYTEEHINYSEEVLTKPLKEKAKPKTSDTTALRMQREDRDLWKLGLNNFTPSGGYQRYGLHLAYERKVGRAWSMMGEISPAWLRSYRYIDPTGFRMRTGLSVRAQVAGRYYYNLERRIRQGRGAGNFSANYLSLVLGSSFGRFSDLPFYLSPLSANLTHTEVAVLYGVQRRLGRYGFVDLNAGIEKLLTNEVDYRKWQLAGSLRIGLVIGAEPVPQAYTSAEQENDIRPLAYVGAQVGVYSYSVSSTRYYSNLGVGIGPYVYAGYHLRPRLAVQVGFQYQYNKLTYGSAYIADNYNVYSTTTNEERTLVLPILMRYNLTKEFMQRVQFDLVGGAAVLRGTINYQSEEYRDDQLIALTKGREQNWAVNPMAGLNVSYGFGRKRQLQLTGEGILVRAIFNDHRGYGYLRPGVSVGLRYRFKYL